MAVGRTVSIFLLANTAGFTSGMAAAQRSATGLSSSLKTQNAGFSTLAKTAAGFGLAAAVGIGSAVSAFSDFDAAMSGVAAATMATGSELDALGEAALTAGESTVFSATEAAGAITELAKAGVSTSDIMGGALTGALDLAAAGELAVADAAAIAASALTIFGLSGSEIPHVADLLAAAAGKAQGSVTDMGAALNQAGLVAAQMGLTIEETVGSLAAFASAGLIGSDAGTSFRSMLLRLANPTAESAQLMDELGIATYDAQGNFIGMEALAGELQTSLSGLTTEQRNAALATIFGSDAIRAASILYEEGAAGIGTWVTEVNDAGFAAEQAAIKTDNLKGDLERLGGAFDSLLISIGGGFDDALRGVVQAVTALVDGFNNLEGTAVDSFFQSVGETAGNLWQILLNVWDALGPVIAGFATLTAGAVLAGLNLIADILSAITGFFAENETAATALALTVGGVLAANFIRAQVAALSLSVTVAALNGSSMAGVIAGTTSLSAALATARTAALGLLTALGPLAIVAVAAVAVANLLQMGEASADAEEAIADLETAIDNAGSNSEAFALSKQGVEDFQGAIVDLEAEIDDMKNTSGVGDFFTDFFEYTPGGIEDATKAAAAYRAEIEKLELEQANLEGNTSSLAEEFGLTEAQILALADAAGIDLTGGFGEVEGPMRDAAEASSDVTAEAEATQAAIDALEGGLLDASEAAGALVKAFEGLTGGFVSVTEAEINFEAAIRDAAAAALALANEALGPMDNALDEATGGLDTHTEAGAAVFGMLTDIRAAGQDYITTLVEQGRIEEAIAAEGALRQSLYDTLEAFGIVGPAADALVNSLIGIPGTYVALIDVETEAAQLAIDDLQGVFDGLTLEALVGVAAGFTAEEVQAMVADVMGTNALEASLGLTVDEIEALAEIAAITGIPYAVLIRMLVDPGELEDFLDGLPIERPVGVPVELLGGDEVQGKIRGIAAGPYTSNILTDADTAPAEGKIRATADTPWQALVTASGDTGPADASIGATAFYPWQALVTALGDADPANDEIAGVAFYNWKASIYADADTAAANSEINAVAANRTSTITVRTVQVVASGGYVGGYALGGPVQGFPSGGPVWGAGTATSDSINARLSNGEFVLNAEATSRNRGALEAANWHGAQLMAVPGYAAGGIIGTSTPQGAINLTPVFNVRVLMGTRDITELVDLRIDQSDGYKKIQARAGQRMSA